MSNSPLAQLAANGVSIWLDDLSRSRIVSGGLRDLITNRSVSGVTTNPTIFAGALAKGEGYQAQVAELAAAGVTAEQAIFEITTKDVADACDILLAYGTPENVENARLILFVLGGGERARHNIFKNSQNVHNHAVEESVEKMIEYISTFVPRTVSPYTFEKAKDDLTELIKAEPDDAKRAVLESAMVRITIDRAIYGRFHLSLAHIIAKMWTYIQDSPHRDELQKRLLEELIDSNNKCSSGYVSRIVNTLSGFGDMSLQISFEDQIVTVLETRLNAEIMNDENGDTIDTVHFPESVRRFPFHGKGIYCLRGIVTEEFSYFCLQVGWMQKLPFQQDVRYMELS